MEEDDVPSAPARSRGFDRCLAALIFLFPLNQLTAGLGATVLTAIYGGARGRLVLASYLGWIWFVDKSEKRGGYDFFWRHGLTWGLRSSFLWDWACNYFPVRMVPTAPLPPGGGPYIFVCHPHGIFGISPMANFGTDATGFSTSFPGLQVHLLGASAIFRIPFIREVALAHGHGCVDRQACLGLLRRGRSIALVPGGAKESLECAPGSVRLILSNRRGFARLALQTGAALVPVFAFGENELYSTVQFAPGSWKRRLQDGLQRLVRFSLPIFWGRPWLPLLPKRVPLTTYVGAPLRLSGAMAPPPGGFAGEPAPEVVAELHAQYCQALREIFESHKAQHGAGGIVLEMV